MPHSSSLSATPAVHAWRPLSPEFYRQSTTVIAEALLGKVLVHETEDGPLAGRIVETEAYLGPDDLAAHSARGKVTARNQVMFGPPGYWYVYLIYGMYHCVNLVTAEAGCPQAILIRAVEPTTGLDIMQRTVGRATTKPHTLAQGPGKLCRSYGITRELNGAEVRVGGLWIGEGSLRPGETVARSPRINIDYAQDWVDMPLRYYISGHPSVSGPAKLRR